MFSKAAFSAAGTACGSTCSSIDAETGNHLWAERFDKPLADLFDMQDEIVARLASALNAELVAAEARRSEQVPSPELDGPLFSGQACFHRAPSPDALRQGQSFFERALALDPEISRRGSVWRRTVCDHGAFGDRGPAGRVRGGRVRPQASLVGCAGSRLGAPAPGRNSIHTNRADQGIGEFEHALALDRNLAAAHGFIGLAKVFAGRSEETEAHVQEALRLSPRDRLAHVWITFAGVAKLHLGCDEEALSRGCAGQLRSIRVLGHPLLYRGGSCQSRSAAGGARSGRGGTGAPPELYRLVVARNRAERQSDLLGSARARYRRFPKSGSPRAMTAARRLAAILAVDVVGYSRLMGEGEAGPGWQSISGPSDSVQREPNCDVRRGNPQRPLNVDSRRRLSVSNALNSGYSPTA